MDLVWRCECGEEWPESGDWKGASAAGNHARHIGHKIIGLVDRETGELIVKGWSIRNAQLKGIGQRKPKPSTSANESAGGEQPKEDRKKSPSAAYGTIKPLVVDLSPELLVLYKIAQARFPEQYGDATLSEWISDCIGGYYADHAKTFMLNKFLGDLRPELATTGGSET